MVSKIPRVFQAAIFLLLAVPIPVRANLLPERASIPGVVGYPQRFTLSCESRSAVDWAAYWGVSIREKKFLNDLPRSDNPDVGFVGDPNGKWGHTPPYSYGVHAEPVAALLRQFGLQAEARRGLSWDDLRAEIASGRPAIVWVIGQMWKGSAQRYKSSDGQIAIVARFEHTMIVTGYDARSVQVVDALSGAVQTYPLKTFIASWNTLGKMAITGGAVPATAPAPSPTPTIPEPGTPPPASFTNHSFMPLIFGPASLPASAPAPAAAKSPQTYSVKRGDYLTDVARRFGLDWRKLAKLNGLQHPYNIYTGQILRLR